MAADPLDYFAREFAKKIQHLLNATICDGVVLSTVVSEPGTVVVAHKLHKKRLQSEPLPVKRGRGKPHCWLDLSYTFCLEDTPDRFPMVESSFFGVYAPDRDRSPLCHFDFERDKRDGYPDAHVQVYGESKALRAWRGPARDRPLAKLHFPVGGKRFRPILEDVIEFLVAERLVPELPPNGERLLGVGREEFRVIQLRSAIRRDPETARQALREFGQD